MIDETPQPENKLLPRRVMLISVIIALIVLIFYIALDQASYFDNSWIKPLPTPWNDNVIYCLIILAAIPASGIGFLLSRQFKPHEPQRQIWTFFAWGWACWVLGEISGLIYTQIYATLPDITLSDLFWTAGYIFFGLSLYLQYALIYIRWSINIRKRKIYIIYFFLIVVIAMLFSSILTLLLRQAGFDQGSKWFSTFLNIFYPICDLAEGAMALWFSFLFRRGVLGRPWLGLLVFAVSDGISSWYWLGGNMLVTPQVDSWLSLFTDILYIGGYLLTALACLSIFLVLRYGTGWQRKEVGGEPVGE
jgi:hypothetical protein